MLHVRVLGPLEVAVDDEPRSLGGPIPRALVVALALNQGRTVVDDVLLETAWSGRPPASGRHALDVYISKLRKAVAPAATIVRSGQGFMLAPAGGSGIAVDAEEFAALAGRAAREVAAGDLGVARQTVEHALALWRGRPFSDLPPSDEWAVESARLEALHRELLQSRAECRVAAGDLSGIAELEAFAAQDAYDEAPQMRLMRALYLAGRQQDALDVFGSYARRVRTELGLEPSAAMVALERAVLNHRLGSGGGADRPRRSQRMFGREQLVAEVTSLFADRATVVTLVGMGGIGKTTAAIAVADALAEDGLIVTWIAAEELSSGDVPARIAQEITGLRNVDPHDVRFERDTPRLLVVDGFESHEREAPYLDLLVGALPSLRVLVTSRRPSRVDAEWIVQLPPLDTPAEDATTLAELRESPAGAMFAELIERRAHGALAGEGAVATAGAICRRLAGIPLALELAAARVGVVSVDELAATLDISALAGGTTAPTHRSMSRVLDSTVALLSPGARNILESAAVFRSSFSATDVAAVANLSESRVEPSLRELYEAGLIVRGRDWVGPTRFTLLDPIREYASELVRVQGREPLLRARHLDRIAARTRELWHAFDAEETQLQAVAQFDGMGADFSAALDHAVAANEAHEAVDLVTHANRFWQRLSVREGLSWCERLADLELEPDDSLRLQRVQRSLLHHAARFDEAAEVSERILSSGAATLHDRRIHAATRADAGDTKEAIALLESILPATREEGTSQELLQTLCYLMQAYLLEGDVETSLSYAVQADDAIAARGASPLARAYTRVFQTATLIAAGDDRRAATLLRESLELGYGLRDSNATPGALLLVADLAISRGDPRGRAIAATAVGVHARAGIVIAPALIPTVPGARVSAMVDDPAELTLAEAIEQAYAVLDEI